MPRLKFLTFDFSPSKRKDPLLAEDRKTQLIQNIEQPYPPKTMPKSSFWFMVMVLLAVSGIAAFSFSRYAILQKENFSLNSQLRKLNQSIHALENENKDLALRTERAESERQKLQDMINTSKKENESLRFEAKKNETRATSATEEKTYLEDMLINKTKEIEKLRAGGSSAAPVSALSGSPDDLVRRLNQKDEEIKLLNEQNKILNEKLQRLYQTADAKMKEINIAKITLEDTISGAKKVIDNEYSSVNLGFIAVSSQQTQGPSATSTAVTSVKRQDNTVRTATKKQGRVLAINEDHGFVVVDMGKVDGIKTGMDLYLKKNRETIATLSVLEVRDVMTACNIRNLKSGKKIEINDLVSVQS